MVGVAAISGGDAQPQGGGERDAAFVDECGDGRYEHPQRFGVQFVGEQHRQVLDAPAARRRAPGPVVVEPGGAGGHRDEGLVGVRLRWTVHGGAAAGEAGVKRVDAHEFAGEGLVGWSVEAGGPEVDGADDGVAGEVDAEGGCGVPPRTVDARRVDVDGGGELIDPAIPVVGVVADARVVAAVPRRDPGGAQHLMQVAGVGDALIPAARAVAGVGGRHGRAHVATRGADPPRLPRRAAPGADLQSGDLVAIAAHVVAVAGGDLDEGLASRPGIFAHLAVIAPVGASSAVFPGEGRLEVGAVVDERIVGQQAKLHHRRVGRRRADVADAAGHGAPFGPQ